MRQAGPPRAGRCAIHITGGWRRCAADPPAPNNLPRSARVPPPLLLHQPPVTASSAIIIGQTTASPAVFTLSSSVCYRYRGCPSATTESAGPFCLRLQVAAKLTSDMGKHNPSGGGKAQNPTDQVFAEIPLTIPRQVPSGRQPPAAGGKSGAHHRRWAHAHLLAARRRRTPGSFGIELLDEWRESESYTSTQHRHYAIVKVAKEVWYRRQPGSFIQAGAAL